ncbi:MAG: translation initiation factor IF-2 [Eubacteriales bacterium]|nr:translation initiation factor IF-2 [Eubacteriales bacterium]
MAKAGLKESIKELNQKAGVILTETERVKRNADIMLQMLRQQEAQFLRQEEEEKQRLRHEQQQEMLKQQTKAWTMPDDDMDQAPAAATAAVETPTAKETPVAAPAAEVPQVFAPEPEAPEVAAEAVVEIPSAKPAETKEEAPAAEAKPAAVTPASVAAEWQAAQPVTPAPIPQRAPARPAARQPAPAGSGPYGRPAGQGPYGRPAPGQGPYGRPAPGQAPFGRPAPGQAPFGRPADGRPAPQRPFGRPAPAGARGAAPRAGVADAAPPMEKERVSNYDPNKKNYSRQRDPERVSKSKRQVARGVRPGMGVDDDVVRGGKRSRAKRQDSAQQKMAPIKIETAYMTADTITVKDLTERIGKPAGEILKKLLLLGNVANINSELDFDTASLVCSEFGCKLEMKLEKTAEDTLSETTGTEDKEEDLQARPPAITIMGHVDHGKTSLLDHIRSAHVTKSEAGGITQHIGAYTVDADGRSITFLDTPGHEAFTAMRARGAQATDIAVLVVAADDGVMPQTVEAIRHAQAANVPIIVAINKMDKADANPERIKQDLTAYNLVPEEWGGDTIMVPVSALTGEGVDQLLEMILLQADVLQLRANPDRLARGIIIEAKLDKTRGPLATVLITNGTLNVGDNIIAGMASGRVRALLNDRGENVKSAGPATPVEISGFSVVPEAGDELIAVEDDKLIRQVAKEREEKIREQRIASSSALTLDNLFSSIKEGETVTLNVLIKADVQGSAEAVRQSVEKLSNDQVKIHILHSGVGAINKDDVNLAATANATIIGFNVRPDNNARSVAAKEGVDIRLYRVIYQAIEDIEKAMKGMLEPEFKEVLLGHAEVRNVFKITGSGTIAGSYVIDGKMLRNEKVRLLRDNVVIFEGKLSSLRRFKDDVREVAEGYECGIGLENYNDIKVGDIVECFTMEEIEQ